MTIYRELIEDYDRKRALYPKEIGILSSDEFLEMLDSGVSSLDRKLLDRELKYGQRNLKQQEIFDTINRHNKRSLYRQSKRPRITTEEKYGREQKWPEEKSFQDWTFANLRFETDKRNKLKDLGVKNSLPHFPMEHDGMPSDYVASQKQQEQYKKWLDEHPFINEMNRQQTNNPETIKLLDTSNEYNQWLQNQKDNAPNTYRNYQTDMMDSTNLNDGFGFRRSEPMDIAFQLLKERKSPEALANKKKYDSEYQKTPKRVKYREQLNAERRKRGIYGKGGKDVSHTQGGKLTLESVHANRARHFKNKGTLRRVK
jgi:hypothetical protein